MTSPHDVEVHANLAVSLDGRIAPSGAPRVALGSPHDRDRMSALRAGSDAILVGGRTFRTWSLPLVPDPGALARLGLTAPAPQRRWWNVVLTRTGDVPQCCAAWAHPQVRPLVLHESGPWGGGLSPPPATPPGEAEWMRRPRWTPRDVLDALAARGVRRVLLEGGGGLLGPFLAERHVDVVHVTLVPMWLGNDSTPPAAEGAWRWPDVPRMRLEACEPVGDEVYLRYAAIR